MALKRQNVIKIDNTSFILSEICLYDKNDKIKDLNSKLSKITNNLEKSYKNDENYCLSDLSKEIDIKLNNNVNISSLLDNKSVKESNKPNLCLELDLEIYRKIVNIQIFINSISIIYYKYNNKEFNCKYIDGLCNKYLNKKIDYKDIKPYFKIYTIDKIFCYSIYYNCISLMKVLFLKHYKFINEYMYIFNDEVMMLIEYMFISNSYDIYCLFYDNSIHKNYIRLISSKYIAFYDKLSFLKYIIDDMISDDIKYIINKSYKYHRYDICIYILSKTNYHDIVINNIIGFINNELEIDINFFNKDKMFKYSIIDYIILQDIHKKYHHINNQVYILSNILISVLSDTIDSELEYIYIILLDSLLNKIYSYDIGKRFIQILIDNFPEYLNNNIKSNILKKYINL